MDTCCQAFFLSHSSTEGKTPTNHFPSIDVAKYKRNYSFEMKSHLHLSLFVSLCHKRRWEWLYKVPPWPCVLVPHEGYRLAAICSSWYMQEMYVKCSSWEYSLLTCWGQGSKPSKTMGHISVGFGYFWMPFCRMKRKGREVIIFIREGWGGRPGWRNLAPLWICTNSKQNRSYILCLL